MFVLCSAESQQEAQWLAGGYGRQPHLCVNIFKGRCCTWLENKLAVNTESQQQNQKDILLLKI